MWQRPKTHKATNIRWYFLDFLIPSDRLLSGKGVSTSNDPTVSLRWMTAGQRKKWYPEDPYVNWTPEAEKNPPYLYFLFTITCRQPVPTKTLIMYKRANQYSVMCVLQNAIGDTQIIIKLVSQLPNEHTGSNSDKDPSIRINNIVKLEGNSKIYCN